MFLLDVRTAFRSVRRNPAYTMAIVLTIALGIGANAAAYNVVYNVLFRPLPFGQPDKLVQLWETTPALPQLQVAVPDFQDWQKHARGFEQMSAYTFQAMNRMTMTSPGEPEIVQATMATHDLFTTLGIRPMVGRDFTAEDEQRKQNVAVISEDLWRRKFGSDPAMVGREVRLEALSFTVIGVVSDKQRFPAWADVWLPFSLLESQLQSTRKYHPIEVIARLRSTVDEPTASLEIQTIAKQSAEAFPETNRNVGAYLIPLSRQVTEEVRPSLLLVWAAVGLVLLIACANVAHLMMGRLLQRRQEIAIQLALGASRVRLIQRVVLESLLLAIIGGVAGGMFAWWLTEILHKAAAKQIPLMEWTGASAPVWIFTAAASSVFGLLFAVPSCWLVLTLHARIANGTRDGRAVTRQRTRLGGILVVGELALAFVVISGAALLLRSFVALLNEEPGFTSRNILTIEVPSARYDFNKANAFFNSQLIPAVRALPGVVAVAAANSSPMSLGATEHSRFATRFGLEGVTSPRGQYPVAQIRAVTPEYFDVLRIPLKRGRWLKEEDRNQPRVLINETLARQFFPNADPTTKRLVTGVLDPKQTLNEIVGVVGDVREMGLDTDVPPTFYIISGGPVMTLLVRTATQSEQVLASIQKTIRQTDPQVAISRARTLEQYVSESLARRRFTLAILVLFSGMGALLTASGIYGLLACSVHARRREFGVRMAVGATQMDVAIMVFRETAILATAGIAVGIILHLMFSRFLETLIYRLSPTDLVSILSAGALLYLIGMLSAWIPAKRASAMDPAEVLRLD